MNSTERKIWTLYADGEVQIAHSEQEIKEKAAEFVRGCGDDGDAVDADNFMLYLQNYNAGMDELGASHYDCLIEEHTLPPLKLSITIDDSNVSVVGCGELAGAQVAVICTDFKAQDYDMTDIMRTDDYEFVGHLASVVADGADVKYGGNLDQVYNAITERDAAHPIPSLRI